MCLHNSTCLACCKLAGSAVDTASTAWLFSILELALQQRRLLIGSIRISVPRLLQDVDVRPTEAGEDGAYGEAGLNLNVPAGDETDSGSEYDENEDAAYDSVDNGGGEAYAEMDNGDGEAYQEIDESAIAAAEGEAFGTCHGADTGPLPANVSSPPTPDSSPGSAIWALPQRATRSPVSPLFKGNALNAQ